VARDEKWCRPHGPWGRHHHHHRHHPPRHWFFARVFLLLGLSVALALILMLVFSDQGFSFRQLRHVAGGTFLVLVIGFFILRRLFSPMRRLMRGVQEISNGNLDFQFEAGRHGELGYLADTFNLMVRRVREMVQSRSRLLLDVSHELRSPLTRLKVALEMMPRNKLKTSMMQDVADMETMLAEILETEHLRARDGKLSYMQVDLAELAREFARRYKGRKPGVKLMGKPTGFWIEADEARVRMVLQNILDNAIKYSSHQRKAVQLRLEQEAEYVVVYVQDFGIGIPDAEQERIFEPFYRVDKSRVKRTGGYGLGLSLCREIMQAHGGEIALQSRPGGGTTFMFKFPRQHVRAS
jgi:signal transduction histidine kinase